MLVLAILRVARQVFLSHWVPMAIGLNIDAAQTTLDRDKQFRRASRHSIIVRALRVFIPFGSVGLAALLVVGYVIARMTDDSGANVNAAPVTGGLLTMHAPRLTGFQPDARSYEVTAKSATQDIARQTEVGLNNPAAKIEMMANSFARIIAQTGIYDTAGENLTLKKDIKIVTDSGYDVSLNNAEIDLKNGSIVTKDAVKVEMKDGRIDAKTMQASESGTRIIFSGGVKSTFTNVFAPPDVDGTVEQTDGAKGKAQ
jgi:lipopolysaccharide export system protein LptC